MKGVKIQDNVFISPNVMTIYSNHKGEAIGKTIIQGSAFIIGEEVVIGSIIFVSRDCLQKNKNLKENA